MIIKEEKLEQALIRAIDNSIWKKEGKSDKVRKFDETLDIIINFRELDIKNPQNKINQEFLLPHPIQKIDQLNVCFITRGDQLVEVKNKGYASCNEEFLKDLNKKDKKVKKKFIKKYNSFICRADMMRDVAKTLGRFLGQAGKMPKPSPSGYGIVTPSESIDKIIDNFKRRVLVNVKKVPMIQSIFGKKSIEFEKNFENLKTFVNLLENILPNGQGNIRSIFLKTTMGKPVRVEEPTGKTKKIRGKK